MEDFAAVDALACEKNVQQRGNRVLALELALASATRKSNQEDIDVRVEIDRNLLAEKLSASFRRWQLVEDNDHEYPSRQVAVSDLDERHAGLERRLRRTAGNHQFGRVAHKPRQTGDFAKKSATPGL